jgi:hypothetical protein
VLGLPLVCDQEQFARGGIFSPRRPVTAGVAGVQPLDEHDVDQGREDGTECQVEPGHEVTSTVAEDNTVIPYGNDG